GDVGLLLTMPRQGLGQAAIAAVANEEQLKRFGGKWAAMAITEPEAGSDSAAIRTAAKLEGEHYVLNGEKIFVTAGDRAELLVVWATLDPSQGRAAIKSFVVERDNPGLKLDRLEHKLGIRASDTANFVLTDCRVPKEALLGSPEIDTKRGFGGVMQTFDNTRPLVAGMAIGVARASLERTRELLHDAGIEIDYNRPPHVQPAAAAEFISMESDWEAARLLTLRAAWMADNRKPNSLQASMAKAKAGRAGTATLIRSPANPAADPVDFEFELPPGAGGPPPHFHPHQEERWQVKEGVMELRLGRRTVHLAAGESAAAPPGTAHSFRNRGD